MLSVCHGQKYPGICKEKKRFWAKLYLFLKLVAFESHTLAIAIFKEFDSLSLVRNVPALDKYASVSAMTTSFHLNLFPWSHRMSFGKT